MMHKLWGFPVWLLGCIPVYTPSFILSNNLRRLFLQPWVFPSHVWTDTAHIGGGFCIFLGFYMWLSPLWCSVLWAQVTLVSPDSSSISLSQRVLSSFWVPNTCAMVWNLSQIMSWYNHGAHLIYCFSEITVLHCLMLSVFKNHCFIYFSDIVYRLEVEIPHI